MKTLEELKANREKNIGKNYEIPEEILLEAEEAYESGRSTLTYITGNKISGVEQEEWWERHCSFVWSVHTYWEGMGMCIELTFVKD